MCMCSKKPKSSVVRRIAKRKSGCSCGCRKRLSRKAK